MIGERISHYHILEKIAAGGMGVVYKAEDLNLKRMVALKFLPKDITRDEHAKQRFVHEAHSASILDHPNICTIYEIEETDDGQMFISMAYYSGETVKQRIELGPLPLSQVVDIAMQVCKGLARAHEAGIIHRDIKPANIMITSRGEVKILDFGLVKLSGQSELTRTGIAVGTAAYMSPEQGSGEAIDHRTDIWSLGIVLFEMISGQLPFQGDTPRSMVYSIIRNRPRLTSESIPVIPGALKRIIKKCLEKNPQDRYRHASDLLEDLKKLKQRGDFEQMTERIRTSSFFKVRIWNRPGKWMLPLVALALTGILILFFPRVRSEVMGWMGKGKIPDNIHLAILPLATDANRPDLAVFGKGLVRILTDRMIDMERSVPSLWVVSGSSLIEQKVTQAPDAQKIFNVNLVVSGRLKKEGHQVELLIEVMNTARNRKIKSNLFTGHITNLSLWQQGLFSGIAEMLDIKLTAATRQRLAAGGTSLPGAFETCVRGIGYLSDNYDAAAIERAIGCLKQAVAMDPLYTLAEAMMAEAYWDQYKLTRDEGWIAKSESCCLRALNHDKNQRQARLILSRIFRERKKYRDAIALLQRVVRQNPGDFYAFLELAGIYEETKDLKKEEECYQKAIDARQDYYAGYDFMGYFYYKNSRFPEAIEMYRKVIDFSPMQIGGYNNLGGIYHIIGKNDLALEMFEKSYKLNPHPDLISNLGTLYFYEGRYQDAAIMYAQALQKSKDNYILLGNLADSYRYIPQLKKESGQLYQRAIRLAEKQLEKEPESADIHSILGLYYARTGKAKKAETEINRALELGTNEIEIIRRSILVFEILSQRERSLQALKDYVSRFGSIEDLEREPDLSALCKDNRYLRYKERRYP
jgi:tetratricopeptide (TPR) repeat protein/tRNA A-37 threonylcarbamoyl transferase component Bud32